MEISLVRIDDRLIHGQIVTDWVKYCKCNRIIVANDQVAADVMRKSLLLSIVPPGLKANIITLKKTIEIYHSPKYHEMKALLLLTCPEDVLRLVENGVDIKYVNIGGMSFQNGKKQISAAVSVSPEDIDCFERLEQKNIKLEIKMLSSDHAVDFMQKLKAHG